MKKNFGTLSGIASITLILIGSPSSTTLAEDSKTKSEFYFSPELKEDEALIKALRENNVKYTLPKDSYPDLLKVFGHDPGPGGSAHEIGLSLGTDVGSTSDLKSALARAKELCAKPISNLQLIAEPNAGFAKGGKGTVLQSNLTLSHVCAGGTLFKVQDYPYPTVFCHFGSSGSSTPVCDKMLDP